jgi:hypothetical protein
MTTLQTKTKKKQKKKKIQILHTYIELLQIVQNPK